MRSIGRWVILIVMLVPLLVGCMGGDDGDDGDPASSPVAQSTATTSEQTPSEEDEETEETPAATAPSSTATTGSATPTQPATTATLTPIPSGIPLEDLQIELELVAEGFEEPTGIFTASDGSGRLFALERPGRIRIIQDGQVLETPFLDITDRVGWDGTEQGLLGLAFHPDYETNGTFYVNYTNLDGDTRISRFRVTDDPNQADAASEVNLIAIDQPASNHNGGNLIFGPDGYLWIGQGDGGGAGDQYENAQNGQTLLGSMLRIAPSTFADPEGTPPYAIPPDNPYVDDPDVLDEIWAIGLRNPWRFSFDSQTGDLYIADVGQREWEEVNVVPAGSPGGLNFGWPIMEGLHCFREESCNMEGLVQPVFEYSHDEGGCSITGGEVYRGTAQPALTGTYFFTDYCSGIIWGMQWHADGAAQTVVLDQIADENFSSFGHDEQGELYLVSLTGRIFRLMGQ